MILTIANEYIAVRHNGHALQSFELRITGAPGAESLQKTAIGIEDLYAIIARISHKDIALIVHRDAAIDKNIAYIERVKYCRIYTILFITHRGNLNWPSSEPSPPTVDRTLPFTSNICDSRERQRDRERGGERARYMCEIWSIF